MSPKRQVHIVQKMAPGGIETFVLDLMRAAEGSSITLSLEGSTDALLENWPALRDYPGAVIGFASKTGLKPSLAARISQHLRAFRPESVMLHHTGPLLYGGVAAKLSCIRSIIHVEHDVWHYAANPRHRWIAKAVERIVRPLHVVQSVASRRTLRELLPNAAIETIPTGIDLKRFRPTDKRGARELLGIGSEVKLIGTAGRLVPVKAQDDLIRAFALMDGAPELAIIGDGPERERLEKLAAELSVRQRVHFLGHRDDVPAILPALDVFCLPSHNEGLPRSILEAQACGVPVVATDVGAVREAVCPATGLIIQPCDTAALATALQAALARAGRMSPRPFVEGRYCWRSTLSAYASLIEA